MREGSNSISVGTDEAAQQADGGGSLAGLADAQNVAQIVDAGLSEFADQLDNAVAFHALLRAEETVGQVFDGMFGKLLQDGDQILGHILGVDGLFDHLGQAIFDADAVAEILYQSRPLLSHFFKRVAEFGDGPVVFASAGLLSEAREGGAQQALDLGIAFMGQIVADRWPGYRA